MSDFPHQPPAVPAPPPPPPAADAPVAWPPAPAAAPGRSPRRWLLPALVGLVALVVGAAGATTVFLLLDWREQSRFHYAVTVFLKQDSTAEQREQVAAALDDLSGAEDITFRTSEEAFAVFREQYKDDPKLLESVRPESLPASFRFTLTAEGFDCAPLKPVYNLPGVAEISVVQYPNRDRLGGPIDCF